MSFFKMKGTHKFSVFRGQVQNKLIETGAITIEFSFSLICFDISFYSEKQKHKSFEKKKSNVPCGAKKRGIYISARCKPTVRGLTSFPALRATLFPGFSLQLVPVRSE